ncbi:uncharacterized protein LOC121431027 [Lytechinus variegatus]|uniref:uncharacterized protein LOC121431027 n=1 Tax=Lytechinus variegatus TaxID=7654 RepID=UPI001BB2B4D1|nr:uncharacterized protein LOC121431027 [Lytechinus variegatus]
MARCKTTSNRWMTMAISLWRLIIVHIIVLRNVGNSQHLSEVRLVNGTSQFSGIVEILDGARSIWLTVCHTPSWGIIDVQVICRQLGQAGASRAFTVEETNPDRPISFYNQLFSCTGNEAEINDCPRTPLDTSTLEACTPAWASCYDEHYLGCYGDSRYDRVLTAANYPFTSVMSPQVCMTYCMELGHMYAGVEYASECYCGSAVTDYARQGRYADKHCQVTCVGNPTESCGGVQKLAVFRTVLQPISAPTTTAETTVATALPTTTALSTPEETTAVSTRSRKTTAKILQTDRRAPPTTTFSRDKASTTAVVQFTGQNVSTSTIAGLAAGGAILFLVCTAVLLFVSLLYRRRRKKASIMADPSPYALSASVEVVMDTTYLDPMNSVGDSAVYSGLSHVSESEFDSSFGGGDRPTDFSTYLGLTFKEMQKRHDEEYASLNAHHKNEGSFVTTSSGDVGDVSELATNSDASGFETSQESVGNGVPLAIPSIRHPTRDDQEQELYDEPHKSGIYISGTGLCPFKYGFEYDAGMYSPVHQGSYCEIGSGATEIQCEKLEEGSHGVSQAMEKRPPLRPPVIREYASVFPHLSQTGLGTNQLDTETGSCHISGRLESGEYATVSDLDFKSRTSRLPSDAPGYKQKHLNTLPASVRLSTEPQLRVGSRRNGDYDSVYFEGRKQSKTLPDSRRRRMIESVPFPSVLYPDYATIGDESEMQLKYEFTNDDTFETEDVVNNMDHSYSYVDHKKLLIAKNKKCSVKDLSISSEWSVENPNYENVNDTEKCSKTTPRISVSSILSQMSPRGQLRKYSSLEEECSNKEKLETLKPVDNQKRKPSATLPRDLRPSEVEYAVVDKVSRNSEPALFAKKLPNLGDDDYDVLQHASPE